MPWRNGERPHKKGTNNTVQAIARNKRQAAAIAAAEQAADDAVTPAKAVEQASPVTEPARVPSKGEKDA